MAPNVVLLFFCALWSIFAVERRNFFRLLFLLIFILHSVKFPSNFLSLVFFFLVVFFVHFQFGIDSPSTCGRKPETDFLSRFPFLTARESVVRTFAESTSEEI